MKANTAKLFTIVLFFYSMIFSLTLFVGAFSRGIMADNLLSTLLFFPVVYYFLREIFWQLGSLSRGFNPQLFLLRQDFIFYLTIILLCAVFILAILRNQGLLP